MASIRFFFSLLASLLYVLQLPALYHVLRDESMEPVDIASVRFEPRVVRTEYVVSVDPALLVHVLPTFLRDYLLLFLYLD